MQSSSFDAVRLGFCSHLSVRRLVVLCIVFLAYSTSLWAQTREEKVRGDREKVVSEGFWIYNDLPRAFAEAEKTGKPIIVVLRCIPCEECVKLDDELVDTDPVVRPLLEKFVCARQVSTNGLDLNLFQYDTDQSFAVFFLNADKTIYGRFGTRSHRTEWVQDVSLPGLAEALQAALQLHENYPSNKQALQGKQGPAPLFPSPEQFPSLKSKFTDRLNYEGNVVKSCIHCHQIGDAVRDYYRSRGEAIPQDVLYPYPHPKVVGITLNPETKSTIKDIESESAADHAGLKSGDQIVALNGQPILSSADVQWVLHQVSPAGGTVAVSLNRNGEKIQTKLQLSNDWRKAGDISWRVSTWGLRRMASGGLRVEPLTADERKDHGIAGGDMALLVNHVGQYNAHAAAKRAGVQKGDVIVKVDGRSDLSTEAAFLEYGVTQKKIGEKVKLTVLRNGKQLTLSIPMQQ